MPERRILMFCHIEKCGGTTLINQLRSRLGIRHVDLIPVNLDANVASEGDLRTTLRRVPFAQSVSGHSLRPYLDYGAGVEKFTLLRDPVRRYFSEYRHDYERRGYTDGFEKWATNRSRWNHQTKFIAGLEDVDVAKRVLEREVAFFGLTERYDEFVELIGGRLPRINGAATAAVNKSRQPFDIDQAEIDLAYEKNLLDVELFAFARELYSDRIKEWRNVAVPQHSGLGFGRYGNLAFRNLYYKPLSGILPFAVHKLPVNAVNAAVAEARGLSAHATQRDS